MRTIVLLIALVLVCGTAFAEYGYNENSYGTGYFRDNSNDGNPYNNVNQGYTNHGYISGNGETICNTIYGGC